MAKGLKALFTGEREKLTIPRSVQQSIPIRTMFKDGVWQVGNRYSKTWRFSDINYSAASHDDQVRMFVDYCGLLNSLSPDSVAKITINNRKLNPVEFRDTMLMKLQGDELDGYRREYNDLLTSQAQLSHGIVSDRYITTSTVKKNVDEARAYLSRAGTDLAANFGKLSSKTADLGNVGRLRILHDFFRAGQEQHFRFNLSETVKKGHSFKDFICPDGLEFKADHFIMGEKWGRVLFLKEYPSFLRDTMVNELVGLPRNLMLSIDVMPIPTDEAVKEMQKRILAVETDITRWQQKQNMANNFSVEPPYELSQMREETKEFLDDLTSRDQRMMFALLTIVHLADSKEQLDADTEALQSIGRKHLCQITTLKYQQEDGLATVLPYGLSRIEAVRTLTTESTAVLNPFSTQEIMHTGGLYQGINAISKNLIMVDRGKLLGPHGFVLGVSGAGKSVTMKNLILQIALNTNDHILIIDNEREYTKITEAVGGEVIVLSPNSPHRINAVGVDADYAGEDNPVMIKSELLMGLAEDDGGALGAREKSVIDRCCGNVLRPWLKDGRGQPPTMADIYQNMLEQKESVAQDLALRFELITVGSLNIFAGQTNVDIKSRITCFDTHDVGSELAGSTNKIVFDYAGSRVGRNAVNGIRTWIFLDEIHLFFRNKYSEIFLSRAWKRYRKKNGYLTGATQNISEVLDSEMARLMLANSEYLVLLNQAASDRKVLAEILSISETQLSYITNSQAGHGLVKVGGAIVPFANVLPTNTAMYQLFTTKPSELV